MTSLEIQLQRKATNIQHAADAIREMKPDTFVLDEALGELQGGDDHRIAAIVAELSEQVQRQARTIDHLGTHVVASQDAEIKRLRERVAELEKGTKAKKK